MHVRTLLDVAKPKRGIEGSGGEESPGHLGRDPQQRPVQQMTGLVIMSTPDGYVVGHGLVDMGSVKWSTPTHIRPWTETRPQDVRIPAVKQASMGGEVELKPARVAKGVPVAVTVGHHIVFGEQMDATARRAQAELRKQFDAMVKNRRSYWRHLCSAATRDLPIWLGIPRGEKCPHCESTEFSKVKAA